VVAVAVHLPLVAMDHQPLVALVETAPHLLFLAAA
jgi:hypothetical protein